MSRATPQGDPQVQEQRRAFREKVAGIDPRRRVSVAEPGAATAMARRYGRAPRGQRVPGAVPGTWTSVALIAAVRLAGVGPALTFAGATDTPACRTYVAERLAPPLRPGAVAAWDDRAPHHNARVRPAVEGAGAAVAPRPPWGPDPTPIETLFSEVTGWLRSAGARTTEAVSDAPGQARRAVRVPDIVGWFGPCGLSLPDPEDPPMETALPGGGPRASPCATQA